MAPGNEATLEGWPESPAIEFTKINAADTPDVCRVSAHPIKSSKGLKNNPPAYTREPREPPHTDPRYQGHPEKNRLKSRSISCLADANEPIGGLK